MSRREFSAKVKVAAFERANGCCEMCQTGKRLMAHDVRYDHIVADGIGGEPTLDNCMVLCRNHHDAKTFGSDVPRIAKTKRMKRKAAGVKKPRSIRAWRRFGGEIVYAGRDR